MLRHGDYNDQSPESYFNKMHARCVHHCCSCLRREASRHGVTGNYGLRAMPASGIFDHVSSAFRISSPTISVNTCWFDRRDDCGLDESFSPRR